jgi:hypothetical protein
MAAAGGGEELVSVEMPAPEGWTKKVLFGDRFTQLPTS